MAEIKLLDTGCVYRNTNPGYTYTFACHSHMLQLGHDELLCAYQRGAALYAVDSVMARSRSKDGGKTWEDEGLIYDPAGDNRRYSYHGPTLTRLDDGSLIINATRWDRSDPDHPLFNEKTGGLEPAETVLLRSNDGGASWSAPEVVALPDGMVLTASGPIVVLKDGQWMQPFDQWHAYHEPGPYKPRSVCLFSSDNGKTWGEPVTFGVADNPDIGHWHGRIFRRRDDRLHTQLWSANMKTSAALPLHRTIGSVDGREWTKPEPTNIPGQTNWAADLGDDCMSIIYTVRETDPPGFYGVVSTDGGKQWDLGNQIHIWDATGRDKIGIDAADAYPRSHDSISYGAPTSTVLDNGDVFCTFWCTEVSVTQIKYARLRVAR